MYDNNRQGVRLIIKVRATIVLAKNFHSLVLLASIKSASALVWHIQNVTAKLFAFGLTGGDMLF